MRKIPLNEDKETRKKIEEEQLALLWKRIKKIGWWVVLAVVVFFGIVGFSDPAIAFTVSASLIASSFFGNNK